MGAAESAPRKITIPNENQFIKITDNLAERLLACQDSKGPRDKGGKGDRRKENDCLPSETQKYVRDNENIPPQNFKNSGDMINYYYGPSMTSLRILQEKERELEEGEKYWKERIQNLNEKHSELKGVMEQEYKKAADEINNQFPKPTKGTQFPCSEEKNKVLKCYNQHPSQALLCALEVSQFADCVQSKRIESLQKKESSAC